MTARYEDLRAKAQAAKDARAVAAAAIAADKAAGSNGHDGAYWDAIGACDDADWAFQAAASPAAILALLADLDAAREALRRAEPLLSEAYQFHRMTQAHAGRVMEAHDALAGARAALARLEGKP